MRYSPGVRLMSLAWLLSVVIAVALPLPAQGSSVSQDSEFVKALRRENGSDIAAQIAAGQDPNFRMPGGKTPLMVAAKIGDLELVRLLLSRGADINAKTQNGGTPLMFSAIRGNPDIVRLLIERGADVNAVGSTGSTPLAEAARLGLPPIAGAHANISSRVRATKTASASSSVAGSTPRSRAASTMALFGALPFPVARRFTVPTGIPW